MDSGIGEFRVLEDIENNDSNVLGEVQSDICVGTIICLFVFCGGDRKMYKERR